jgi:hypothetical protein
MTVIYEQPGRMHSECVVGTLAYAGGQCFLIVGPLVPL